MDLRNLLGKLDQLSEGTMASAEKKSRGPKFTGKWKGTDPASAAKDKYVGGGMEESIIKELEETLQKQPARDLKREFAEYKRKGDTGISKDQETKFHAKLDKLVHDTFGKRKDEVEETKRVFTELELAVMEGGHELIGEVAPPPAPAATTAPAQNKPQLGADVTQQDKEKAQQAQQAQAQADAAKQAATQDQQQQSALQKGVNMLKQAGAAVSNPAQLAQAFDKVGDREKLNPADRNNVASAGTVLAPIMSNPSLAGKFKDLVTQASAAEKQEQQKQQQQQQQQQAQQTQQPATPNQPVQPNAPSGAPK